MHEVRMEFYKVFYLMFIVSCKTFALPAEPVCSKFDYEMKTLEAMLRTEQKVEKMVEDMKAIRETVFKELGEIKDFKSDLLNGFKTFKNNIQDQTYKEQEQRREEIKVLTTKVGEKIEMMDNTLEEFNKTKDPVIAFSVRTPTKSLVNGVPIFSEVITNIGDGYNKDTGIFTSPADGLYSLVFTVASFGQHDIYCHIYYKGSSVTFGRTYSDNSYTTAAEAVNLMVSKGDEIKLSSCIGWNNVYVASFSGVLIK